MGLLKRDVCEGLALVHTHTCALFYIFLVAGAENKCRGGGEAGGELRGYCPLRLQPLEKALANICLITGYFCKLRMVGLWGTPPPLIKIL